MTPRLPNGAMSVYICGSFCGQVEEDRHGALSFVYEPEYSGVPLSLSMPLSLARYEDRIIRPYLMGLLPDDESIRTRIGAPYGISGDNPFRLLRIIGLDCPGAVQLCPPGSCPPPENPECDLTELTESDIGSRLADIREDAAAAWTGSPLNAGHWSLGGCQSKLAIRLSGGHWFACSGAAATTHILKPGVTGLDAQALVEHLSMKTAKAIGLPVASTSYRMFGSEPAVIIERYDRRRLIDNSVLRIHQEDLCQALSVMPTAKYAEQGGPTTPRIIALLRQTGDNARENVYRFILYLFFNYLLGATDAHAKNHSLIFMEDGTIRLAPLYDVASIAPYQSLRHRQRKPLRAALSIGGENRFGMVGATCVAKMVETCELETLGLDLELLCDRLQTMASLVPDAIEAEVATAEKAAIPGIDRVGPCMAAEIRANCNRTLDLL